MFVLDGRPFSLALPDDLCTVDAFHHALAPLVPNLDGGHAGFAEVHVLIHRHAPHVGLGAGAKPTEPQVLLHWTVMGGEQSTNTKVRKVFETVEPSLNLNCTSQTVATQINTTPS